MGGRREKEERREPTPINWLIPQMSEIARAGLDRDLERPGLPCG